MMVDDPRVEALDLFGRYAKNKAINSENFTVYIVEPHSWGFWRALRQALMG